MALRQYEIAVVGIDVVDDPPSSSMHVFLEILSEFQNCSAEHLHNHYLSEHDENGPSVTLLTYFLCQLLWSIVLHNHRQDVQPPDRTGLVECDPTGAWLACHTCRSHLKIVRTTLLELNGLGVCTGKTIEIHHIS